MDEIQPSNSPDELVTFMCWFMATQGERFFEPDETAKECIDSLDLEDEVLQGIEHGKHQRAWLDAVEFFEQLEAYGYDPKYRANYYIEAASDDLPAIDWRWWGEA